jgi:hypothetical protein
LRSVQAKQQQKNHETPSQSRAEHWDTPVTSATQEAEIGKIMIPGQPGQKVHETLFQQKKLGVVVCAFHLSYRGKHKIGGLCPGPPGQKARPYLQNSQSKKGWRCD